MALIEWARKHNISPEALAELQGFLVPDVPVAPDGQSEAAGQQRIRLEASKRGVRLWRNNNGACMDEKGNFIRYGLANDSAAMNRKIKSSDLIGITPVTITPAMVGGSLGVFTAIECKRGGWRYSHGAREQAQLAFMELVISMGGIAQFATGPADIWN